MGHSSFHLLVMFLLPCTFMVASGDIRNPFGPPIPTSLPLIPFAPPLPSLPPVGGPFMFPSVIGDLLLLNYYDSSCPDARAIISNKVNTWVDKDLTLAGSLIELHFHDCAVRGCDASILLNHPGSERSAPASKTLRGFEVIDDIKAELEKKCPKTVSCADILTAAARDAAVKMGGPYWQVAYGRKDGRISVAKDTDLIPTGRENITFLIEFFESKGLNLVDLVVLSGAHTLGRTTCEAIQDRLFNFKGTGQPDPSMDAGYLNFLRRKCRWASEYVDLDATSPRTFDNSYYKNLQKSMGLLSTDQLLFSDSRTSPLVAAFASQPSLFFHQFSVSMINLGSTQVLTGDDEGEVRVNCNYVNA